MGSYMVNLPKETIIKGDTPTLKWQLKLNNNVVNIVNDTLTFAVKQTVGATEYLLEPRACHKVVAADGKFSATLTETDTKEAFTDARGEIQWQIGGNGAKITIARFPFEILEDIID